MRVWLLTVGEPLPTDDGSDRSWRTGLLAEQLLKRGHEVVWWSSGFDHFRRRQRCRLNVPIRIREALTVWHLDGVPYRRNISINRLRNHRQVAENFRRWAPSQPRPDVIVSSLPTLELCCAAVDHGASCRASVALDIRDLWPDVLLDLAPRPMRHLAHGALYWMTRQLRYAARRATAIVGVTDEFVQWGLKAAHRPARPLDRAFSMAYSARTPTAPELARAEEFWRAQGIERDNDQFIVSFFGTLGWMFDFDTVLRAARRLGQVAPDVKFVICGTGDRLENLRRNAAGLSNILLPGRVSAAEIWWLMWRSSAGLAPYRAFRNFQDNLPNKPIEYLCAGLPIIATRLSVLARLLRDHGCGTTYEHGDDAGLAIAVAELARDHVVRQAMAQRAGALYRERFVAERVYDGMAAHLEAIGRTNGVAPAHPTGTGERSEALGVEFSGASF